MLYVFCVECRDKITINKRYNAYSVVAIHGKRPRVDFAIARQPWAIKRTTLTALRDESIYIVKYIHWNTSIKHVALRRCNIHNGEYIHQNIGIKNMTLHHESISIAKRIYWNIGMTPMASVINK